MNLFGRGKRHADDWASPHQRARTRAAQRLDWPLEPSEATWLEVHLVSCPACRRRAAEYSDNRERLRKLRERTPTPPRDLWARTAAAIELESQRGRRSALRGAPIGPLSGVLVLAVVLGATLLSNTPTPTITVPTEPGSAPPAEATASLVARPAGTPLVVVAGDVPFVRKQGDGTFGYGTLGVDSVCAKKGDVDCPMVPDASATALMLEYEPQTIISSPDEDHAVMVTKPDESNASEIFVLALPKGSPDPETPEPATEAPASAPPSSEPPATASAPPASDDPGSSPAVSESPDRSTEPSEEPASPTPQETEPTGATPTPTPESVAIASGLVVMGQTEAYSPDGDWFAFTARPADGSHGPDIYLWRVGAERAQPVTDDHRSVFGSWAGDKLVGSRLAEGGAEAAGETFILDPDTGTETQLEQRGWRPVVAPDGDSALVFDGSVSAGGDHDIDSAEGTLELRVWNAASGSAAGRGERVMDVAGAAFDARWDDTGTAFAVWVRDAADPSFGRLSLYFVDAAGNVSQPENAPRAEPALPGFSIGEGRLAWATPAGQGGEGSRVQIVAWTDEAVGSAETAPGDEVVVIR